MQKILFTVKHKPTKRIKEQYKKVFGFTPDIPDDSLLATNYSADIPKSELITMPEDRFNTLLWLYKRGEVSMDEVALINMQTEIKFILKLHEQRLNKIIKAVQRNHTTAKRER